MQVQVSLRVTLLMTYLPLTPLCELHCFHIFLVAHPPPPASAATSRYQHPINPTGGLAAPAQLRRHQSGAQLDSVFALTLAGPVPLLQFPLPDRCDDQELFAGSRW